LLLFSLLLLLLLKERNERNIVRVIKSIRLRWADHVATMEEGRNAFKILTGIPAGNRSFGRPRRRLENNIRVDLKK
jgi:hypothetical protein